MASVYIYIYKCIMEEGILDMKPRRERERERVRLDAAFQRGNTVDTVHSFRTGEGEGNRILGRVPPPPILRRRRRQAAELESRPAIPSVADYIPAEQ